MQLIQKQPIMSMAPIDIIDDTENDSGQESGRISLESNVAMQHNLFSATGR